MAGSEALSSPREGAEEIRDPTSQACLGAGEFTGAEPHIVSRNILARSAQSGEPPRAPTHRASLFPARPACRLGRQFHRTHARLRLPNTLGRFAKGLQARSATEKAGTRHGPCEAPSRAAPMGAGGTS